MADQLFFARLVANRPDFVATMTADEQATMRAHGAFLQEQLAAGSLVVAGPVVDPAGVFGMGVFQAGSLAEVEAILARDPANAVGRYHVAPMGPCVFRPAPAR